MGRAFVGATLAAVTLVCLHPSRAWRSCIIPFVHIMTLWLNVFLSQTWHMNDSTHFSSLTRDRNISHRHRNLDPNALRRALLDCADPGYQVQSVVPDEMLQSPNSFTSHAEICVSAQDMHTVEDALRD